MDTPATTPRSSQVALAVFAAVLLGLLVFRGYGNRVGARPTDHHPATYRIDLNAADRAELQQLDGVGPALADRIVDHRTQNGPFPSVEALDDVHGIGPRTLDKVRPQVTVSGKADPPVEKLERKPAPARAGKVQVGDPPIDVNAATEAELMRLPGVGPVTARKIVEARGREKFRAPDDLLKVKGIGPKTLDAIRPFVVCQ